MIPLAELTANKKNHRAARRENRANVDLVSHHSLCEMNFHRLLRLTPKLFDGRTQWQFTVGVASDIEILIEVTDAAPYTTTLCISQSVSNTLNSCIQVRLYHDVEMAEIIAWDKHRNWRVHYDYPNSQMYHPDEKFALNRFLYEWLLFCSREGNAGRHFCDGVLAK